MVQRWNNTWLQDNLVAYVIIEQHSYKIITSLWKMNMIAHDTLHFSKKKLEMIPLDTLDPVQVIRAHMDVVQIPIGSNILRKINDSKREKTLIMIIVAAVMLVMMI